MQRRTENDQMKIWRNCYIINKWVVYLFKKHRQMRVNMHHLGTITQCQCVEKDLTHLMTFQLLRANAFTRFQLRASENVIPEVQIIDGKKSILGIFKFGTNPFIILFPKDPSRQAHDVNITSPQRRCNVMTLHRRWGDVIFTSYARWDLSDYYFFSC